MALAEGLGRGPAGTDAVVGHIRTGGATEDLVGGAKRSRHLWILSCVCRPAGVRTVGPSAVPGRGRPEERGLRRGCRVPGVERPGERFPDSRSLHSRPLPVAGGSPCNRKSSYHWDHNYVCPSPVNHWVGNTGNFFD